jgi:hypothetical protein
MASIARTTPVSTRCPARERRRVHRLAFSPDGSMLAAKNFGGEGTVRVGALDLDELLEIAHEKLAGRGRMTSAGSSSTWAPVRRSRRPLVRWPVSTRPAMTDP